MATAEQLRAEMTAEMQKQGYPFRVVNEEDNIVRLSFGATSSKDGGGAHTVVLADFDENGDDAGNVHFVAYHFGECSKEDLPQVLLRLNEYNSRYRWVTFYADIREDTVYLNCDSDAMLVAGAAAHECIRSCFRMSDIVEDVIVDLGDLITTDDEGRRSRNSTLAALQALFNK